MLLTRSNLLITREDPCVSVFYAQLTSSQVPWASYENLRLQHKAAKQSTANLELRFETAKQSSELEAIK